MMTRITNWLLRRYRPDLVKILDFQASPLYLDVERWVKHADTTGSAGEHKATHVKVGYWAERREKGVDADQNDPDVNLAIEMIVHGW